MPDGSHCDAHRSHNDKVEVFTDGAERTQLAEGGEEMDFCRVTTLEEALAVRSDWGDDGRVLAGGTDVMVQYLSG